MEDESKWSVKTWNRDDMDFEKHEKEGIREVLNTMDLSQHDTEYYEQIEKKLLTIYYPEKQRNKVVDWAKANGYSTSSYLGRPIVKFKQLYLIIERTK